LNTKNNPTLDESSTEYQKLLADLRGELLNQVRAGRTWKEIATAAYVGASTAQRFAEGTTVNPTTFTVRQLAKVAGYRMAVVPSYTQKIPGELG
jgi:hypothetical protein